VQADIAGNPDFGHLKMRLDRGDSVYVESGAMSAMDDNIDVQIKMLGGFFPAMARKLLAGESLLVGHYSSSSPDQRLYVSPAIPGQVLHKKMQGDTVMMQAGSFMACTDGVKLDTVFGGIKAIFSGEGMFFLKVTGNGDLWYNAYGSIVERELNGSELTVDTGHIVGWEPSLNWEIRGMGNLMSTIFSGEGLVMRFSGSGKIWLQTRSLGGLTNWLRGYC
jgi:uncharacterized protein (TIGR00266 family)